ncbi:HD domain-containing protein [Halolamina salifodinae]|uniref:HD superfamily phosphohydrolase n=1 Tax=Halolamina salifodinae TaxID=1202767 RepID=A0A8T4GYU1_9EURY|nr:HD domain-containing protein [Halolamina salifodinae]MBP1987580.1 HD superfamily phosphohydrolase [Halolamina salifodinae]
MTTIKDSVHDHIEVEGVAADLLDTPAVQRLRHIKQLGTVQLAYPSANHTRFEHSLGVYHLAEQALEHMDVDGIDAERVRAAAMLHDVGHGPFSHNIESLTHRETGKYHDDVDELLAQGQVGDVLRRNGLDPSRVAGLVAGEGKYGQLVSGELDVDRMDYLVRDAHHTGVPYGTIDPGRLVRALQFVDGELVLAPGNVQSAESLLVARALMNPTVYSHHVARISKAMLRQAAERLLRSDPDLTAEELRRMDDHGLIVAMRLCAETAAFARRYAERDLYKRAVWAELGGVPDWLLDADHEDLRELEAEIAGACDLDPREVIVDVASDPAMTESTSRVMVGDEIRELGRQSPLVKALRTAQYQQWRLGVYTVEEASERVGRVAVDILGLEVDGALVSERRGRPATLDEFADAT